MRYYVIPARKGSKRFPHKNRKLLRFTLESIPKENYKDIIISTDDEEIVERVKNTKIKVVQRSRELASDTASLKPVLKEVIQECKLKDEDDIIMLCLTYPNRFIEDINKAYDFFKKNEAKSLVCAIDLINHPYLCFYKLDDYKGKCVIEHDLYRTQDFPDCFQISHYICILKVGYIDYLNKNLYSDDTIYYKIEQNILDVDIIDDYEKLL